MLPQTVLLLTLLGVSSGYSCSNRLYRGQRLTASQYLCSRSQNYRLLFSNTGKVQINESFPRETSFRPPPQTLFSASTTPQSPSYMTISDSGDFIAVATDGTVYWRANVTGADFLELQDTGVAVLFAKNASTTRMLWKSLSMYSLRLAGGASDSEGRLEFYFNNTWGAVSIYGFGTMESAVTARTLGFSTCSVVTNTYGNTSGPMWMDEILCNGREDVFHECPFGNPWYLSILRLWWGDVLSSSTSGVAVSCQGGSTPGVQPPTAHVCTDRLYVGQTLALGDTLCAGPNGEYTLRFNNKNLDTAVELWYKLERKWIVGLPHQMPVDAELRLEADGLFYIIGTSLHYNLFNVTATNASFAELQDNGVLRVVTANGNTGWSKSPEDFCYTEKLQIISVDSTKLVSSSAAASPIECLNLCNNISACTTVAYNYITEFGNLCTMQSGSPYAPSSNSTYYEKIPGCSSGFSCYRNYSYDRWNGDTYISSSTNIASGSACTALCDADSRCVSAFYTVSGSCFTNWRRMNESANTVWFVSYFKKSSCPPVAASLLPVKECPTKLVAGSFLLSKQYLCSPNGQHLLFVEKTGRMVIDGGTWISNSAVSRSGYLQYTDSSRLIFRVDDGSIAWQVDPTGKMVQTTPAGYLMLSNTGKLQMFSPSDVLIWDQQNGFYQILTLAPVVEMSSPGVLALVDGNVATCNNGTQTAVFRLNNVIINLAFNLTLAGNNLQCSDGPSQAAYYALLSSKQLVAGIEYQKLEACKLLTATLQQCRFACVCHGSLCDKVGLHNLGCGSAAGDACEAALECN